MTLNAVPSFHCHLFSVFSDYTYKLFVPLSFIILLCYNEKRERDSGMNGLSFCLKNKALCDKMLMDGNKRIQPADLQRPGCAESISGGKGGCGDHVYHSSAMDIENLSANQSFSELPETYTIFITENDAFGDGKPFHRIERKDLDGDGEPLFDDGEHILYVNGAFRDDSDIGKLMHDFGCWDPDEMNFDLMKQTAKFYKEDPKGVEIVCVAFEQTRNEKAIRIAMNLIEKGKLSFEEIAEVCELPLEKVQELAKQKGA